ncbi:polyphosphate kinase 2 (PPK2) domain-containing protein [Ditylenchus destructor]|nr:polyphosphate kinase 2 (PPK2) domain-containing protein [Ditylenchus destructor]
MGDKKADKRAKQSKLSKADYYDHLLPLQVELNNLARWLQHTGKRLLILFEGRDAAGKGGVISAISETLNPRQCRTVALGKPSERERGQWYFQRYASHLPAAGEIVLMDRSWYNRAGVERVMGYCTPEQVDAFLKQVPTFERLLVDDGILLFKYWLCVDQEQQEKRFAERHLDPLKGWKLDDRVRQFVARRRGRIGREVLGEHALDRPHRFDQALLELAGLERAPQPVNDDMPLRRVHSPVEAAVRDDLDRVLGQQQIDQHAVCCAPCPRRAACRTAPAPARALAHDARDSSLAARPPRTGESRRRA